MNPYVAQQVAIAIAVSDFMTPERVWVATGILAFLAALMIVMWRLKCQ